MPFHGMLVATTNYDGGHGLMTSLAEGTDTHSITIDRVYVRIVRAMQSNNTYLFLL